MNLDDIIEYDEEGTNLDFKKKEYKKENYMSLIKDVMSMANALNTENKRIIIGVKHKPGSEKIFHGIEEIEDQAIFENIIQENIEPNINFQYYAYSFKGLTLGILEIFDNFDKPYMMKKDYNNLKKGDMWIRKGSRQSKVTREDLNKMMEIRKKSVFENKVSIGFGEELEKEIRLFKIDLKKEELPSEIEKRKLRNLLKRLDERYSQNDKISELDNIAPPIQKKISKFAGMVLFSEFNDSEKSIRIGYNEFNLPIYNNREQLLENIENASYTYYEDDCYYLYEENSNKVNIYIYNDGTEFLEDVRVELYFDSNVFEIPNKIHEKSKPGVLSLKFNANTDNYPNVYEKENFIAVAEEHKQIRHKILTKVFFEDLRILINSNVEVEKSKVKYKISARNLSNHIVGAIFIELE